MKKCAICHSDVNGGLVVHRACAEGLAAERDAEIERLQAAQRWIPVTEELPEPSTEVLVLTDAGGIRQGYIGHATGHWCSGGFVMVPTVTHWMPLPAPPEEKK